MSPFLSFSHPCLSLSLPPLVSLSFSLSYLFFFLSFSLRDSLCIFLPHLFLSLSSLSLFFSRPYLSISLEPRPLSLPFSLSLSRSCLSLYHHVSRPIFLSPTLSLFLSFSLSHPCLSPFLSLLSLSHTPVSSLSLSLSHSSLSFSLSLSPIPISLFPTLSLFPSFSLPSLSSSSLSPSHVSLSIFVSPLSPLLPLSGSLPLSPPPVSLHIFLSPTMPIFLSFSLSHSCPIFYILLPLCGSLSFSLTPVFLSLPRKIIL